MRTLRTTTTAVVVLALAAAPAARAENLADLIPNLFNQRIILAPPPPGAPSHEAHFLDQQALLVQTGRLLNSSLASQVSTFPLGSSAGGFTYQYDSALGVFSRSTESFGPIYAERAQTLGHGKWNTGVSYLQADYDKIDDIDLDGGRIGFPLTHLDVNHDGTTTNIFVEGDVINVSAKLAIKSRTTD